jgi:uncharacterized protein (DUF305 family)
MLLRPGSPFGFIALLTITACASGRSSASSDPAIGAMGPAAAVARARADSLRLPYTKADIDFMSGMISHHAQAIKMASWAPTHGASPALVRFAERVVVGQSDEIAMMQSWLRDRLQPVPEADPAGMKMKMGDMEHVMLMPGMLTAEQMKELDSARGKEFDRLFLTFMIQHHRGAIDMVRQLFSAHGAAQDETVFKFANEVEIDQTEEIQRMQQMLLEL